MSRMIVDPWLLSPVVNATTLKTIRHSVEMLATNRPALGGEQKFKLIQWMCSRNSVHRDRRILQVSFNTRRYFARAVPSMFYRFNNCFKKMDYQQRLRPLIGHQISETLGRFGRA
jgi:hypothetical protein